MAKRIAVMLLGASIVAIAGTSGLMARDAVSASTTGNARARAQAIVARMTLDEKIALVHGLFPPFAKGKTPNELIPSAGHIDGIPRLGVPLIRESDASLGVANQVEQRKGDVATALPSSLASAATFDPEIARAGGAMIGSEARAKRFNVLLAGGVNLTRDPFNGRNFEYLGEDPLLAGRMAGAHIQGVQSNRIVSTVKHFALNSQETGRMVLDARIDEAAFRESDLLAFQIAIETGNPGSVMCAYNKVNGDYACENDWLLNKVLKRDWGYKGWVMSDWGAVHSTAKAANNGLDQESGQELDSQIFFDALKDDVQAGKVKEARLDDMVVRYLTGLIETGLYDNPVPDKLLPIPYARNALVAERAAEAGIVLLKNDGNLLPLTGVKRIVVIGGRADVGVLSGGGSSQVRSVGGAPVEIPLSSGAASSFARITYHASSPLKALRAAMPGAIITFVDGQDKAAAAEAARKADLAIVFATQWTTEAQDVPDLSLPYGQDALIDAVAAAQPRNGGGAGNRRTRADALAGARAGGDRGLVSRAARRRRDRQYPDRQGQPVRPLADHVHGERRPGPARRAGRSRQAELARSASGGQSGQREQIPAQDLSRRLCRRVGRRLSLVRKEASDAAVPVRLRAQLYQLHLPQFNCQRREDADRVVRRREHRQARRRGRAAALRLARRVGHTDAARGFPARDAQAWRSPPRDADGRTAHRGRL